MVALGRLGLSYAVGGVSGAAMAGYIITLSSPRNTILYGGIAEVIMALVLLAFMPRGPQTDSEGKASAVPFFG